MDPQDVLAMADERFERRLTQESAAIRLEIAGVRQEIAREVGALRQEIAMEAAALRQENAALRAEMERRFDELKATMADWRTDIIKWSFLFWTGQVLTTIGFLLVILRTR